jgi:hypothetical protein
LDFAALLMRAYSSETHNLKRVCACGKAVTELTGVVLLSVVKRQMLPAIQMVTRVYIVK